MNVVKDTSLAAAFKTTTEFSKPENMQAEKKKEKENPNEVVLEVKKMQTDDQKLSSSPKKAVPVKLETI